MLEALPVKTMAAGGRAVVRVLPQPLYDTEVIHGATSEVNFYTRPIGQSDASGVITSKTLAHTNLQQSSQIAKPYEFDLFGFNLKLTSNTLTSMTQADFYRYVYGTSGVTGGAAFEFKLGNRVYLDVPLADIPSGTAPEGFGTTTADTAINIHNGVGHRSNIYKFNVGKYLVHIRSTEAFGIRNFWAAAITPAADSRAIILMQGLLYNAI